LAIGKVLFANTGNFCMKMEWNITLPTPPSQSETYRHWM